MEVTCLNCGAINRNTGRFCARCGQVLPKIDAQGAGSEPEEGNSLELPWLQAVKDKAVLPTTGLDAQKAEPQPPAGQDAAQPPVGAQQEQTQAPTEEPQTPEQSEPQKPAEPADAPPPTWVVSILEPTATAPPPEGSYESEELAHIMPWVHGAPEGEQAEGAEAEAEDATEEQGLKTPGLPPWLGDVTVQEMLQSVPTQQPKHSDVTGFEIEGIEPFALPQDESHEDATPATLPDFMRQADIASAAQHAQDATQPTPVGSEPRAVTAPPSNFNIEDMVAGPGVHDTPVRSPRPGAVEALASLLQPVAATETHRTVTLPGTGLRSEAANEARANRRGGSKLTRWLFPDGLIYLLILASLLAVVIIKPPFGDTSVPASPGVTAFYDAIEKVPTDMPVLVVYDWDAGKSAEMSVLATAVMQHIMQRQLSFVTVSTVPQGPGFAQEITDALKNDKVANYEYEYGTNYLVLGYLPGNEAALRTLVGNFKRALPLDYVNSRPIDSYQLTAGGALNKVEDFALIVDLAGSEADMRNWIEQVASRTNVPVVAAVPQGLEPMARPYLGVPGAKLTAVVSGTAGAYAYVHELEQHGHGGGLLTRTVDLNTRLNAQSVAALLVALVIAAAFVTQGARKILRRRA